MAIRRQLFGEMNGDVAGSMHNIGITYDNLKKYDEALKFYTQSLDIRKKLFGEQNSDVVESLNKIGKTYYNLNRYEDARKIYN